ncbi:hypothetical protein PCH70_34740 [Pseudomonas cichorii JBC1]|nr:hypothetical protein PCH70_34740 [Pseudomonas cichorii JBC1]
MSCVNQHSFHVVPSVSGLPETAFGTHDFSRSVSGRVKSVWTLHCLAMFSIRNRRVATTFPVCWGDKRHPLQQKLCQEEESTIGSGRDEASRTSLVLHSPMVVHLHPTRIPDNSGAAVRRIRSGLAFTASFYGKFAHHCLRRCSRNIRS